MFSIYDSRVYFFPGTSGTTAVFYDALRGRRVHLKDGLDGDTLDGTFSVVQQRQAQNLVLKNGAGAIVSAIASATTATLKVWGGVEQTFDIINLRPSSSPAEYVGRLKSIKDANLHTLNVVYRDSLTTAAGGFTAQQLTDSPERRLQIYQVTDWQGDVGTFNYGTTTVSGRWAVSSIVAPGSQTSTYSYTNGLMTSVAVPGGVTFSYAYGQDATSQAMTVQTPESDGTSRTVYLTNDYMLLIQYGFEVMVSQPVGVIRAVVNPATEAEYIMVPDGGTAGIVRIYQGAGMTAEFTMGQSIKYYTNGWTIATPGSTDLATGSYETTYMMTPNATTAQLYTGKK